MASSWYNYKMDEKTPNDKVTSFVARKEAMKNRKLPVWEGFEYYKTTKDSNGFSFNYEHLQKYSRKNKYTISVLRQVEGKTCLYNYFVENADLGKFFKCCFDGKIEGEIIEIDKFNPEILA